VSKLDAKDWYVMLHMGGALTASTYFVFLHPEHFNTYCTFVGAVGAIFHWLVIRDDKVPDAVPSASKADPS
jgi:hypothetical protein